MTKCSIASFFVFVVCFIFPVLAANNRAENILSENDNFFWVNFNRTCQNLAIFATKKKKKMVKKAAFDRKICFFQKQVDRSSMFITNIFLVSQSSSVRCQNVKKLQLLKMK